MTTLTDITTTPLSGLNYIDALLDTGPDWNFAGTGANLITYTFSISAGTENNSGADPSYNSGSLRAFNASQQGAVRTALAYLARETGIVFSETTDGNSAALHFAAADLVSATTTGLSSWSAAYSRNPVTDAVSNYQVNDYIYLDNVQFASRNASPVPGTSGYETLLHELGHALGLKHPFEDAITLPASESTTQYTLMAYDHVGGPYNTMRSYDVAALNWLYGRDGLGGTLGIGSTTGARYLTGSAASDTLVGTAFNDTLRGEQGNDMMNGAGGIDTAIFNGNLTEYRFTELTGDLLSVSGPDGVDTLESVEWLQFTDRSVRRADLADTTAPASFAIKVPVNSHGYVAGNTPHIVGTSEAGASIKVYSLAPDQSTVLIGAATADAQGNFSAPTTMLGYGSFTVFATATDVAGNVSPRTASLSFNVDADAPRVPSAVLSTDSTGMLSTNQAAFSGTAEAGTTIRLVDSIKGLLDATTVGADGNWQLTTAPLSNGAYHVAVQSVDLADNATSASSNFDFSVSSALNRLGTAANDSLTGSAGNNAIDGLAGIDTAVYAGSRTGYTVTKAVSGYAISGAATGIDALLNVERIQFGNANLALDIDGNGGQIYRLYAAAMDRVPDLQGIGFWMSYLDKGLLTLPQIANYFLTSPEFTNRFGANLTDAQFVTTMYEHVIHRAPEQQGFDFYMNAMAGGTTRADVLTYFSASPENQAQVIGAIVNGIDYTLYTG